MLDRIKTASQEVASTIWSLPGFLIYPLIIILAVVIPGVTVVLVGAGVSTTVALSPVLLATVIIWYLAKH
ncbi:hypothetical protein [Haloarcula sp. JP-L23]|uniref:hypothetical protein n=1 Tax=Haloarcula sp. JP-L23 TaxID=2716717 RepID=UPI00140E9F7F|nr:hypothetical protein G9465_25100 [Haloarcula sp. JP-L23]